MRWRVLLTASLLLVGLLLAACRNPVHVSLPIRPAPPVPPTPTLMPPPVVPSKPTYRVKRGEVVSSLRVTGRVAPIKEESLFFRVSGRVQAVYVERDDTVKAGQVLAELDMDTLQRDLAGAKLNLERAQVRLIETERSRAQSIALAQLDLDTQKTQLEGHRAKDPQPRRVQVEVDLERVRLTLQKAQADYDAIAWRGDRAATPQAIALQQATLDYRRAKAAYDLALQDINAYSYQIIVLENAVRRSELILQNLQVGVDPLLRNDVQQAELMVKRLEAESKERRITATMDGQVLTLNLEPGRLAEAFKPAVILGDVSSLEIVADLPEEQLKLLAEGMEGTLEFRTYRNTTFPGVLRLLPYPYGGGGKPGLADQDLLTHILLLDSTVVIDLGDQAQFNIYLERKADALWLPPEAIRTYEKRKYVVVQEEGVQRRLDVRIGIESKDRIEILESVTEGQEVLGP